MSRINGDQSRFHRMRKQKVQRRMRNRAMYARLAQAASTVPVSRSGPPVAVSKRIDAAHE